MQPAAFSTGVTIQYPQSREAKAASNHHNEQAETPFPFPADSRALLDCHDRTDTEAYSMCQQLAYHFAYDTTRQAVQEILHKNNNTSYCQVLTFLEQYCTRIASASDLNMDISSLDRQQRDPNAPVLFPAFHGYPTAAIIAGADATSSDLWVEPLTLKLRRTFPLCILVQRDVASARRFIEWLAAKLAKLCAAKQGEEKWLEEVVETFDLLPLKHVAACVGTFSRRKTRVKESIDTSKENEDEHGMSDDSFVNSVSDTSSDEFTCGTPKRKRKQPRVAYSRWSMSKLLSTIQYNVNVLIAPKSEETSWAYIAMLDELVHNRLEEVLNYIRKSHEKENEIILQSIACFDQALVWLQAKISTCQKICVKLLNVASESKNSAPVHVGTTEMAMARVLHRVFRQYTSFLEDCTMEVLTVTDRRKLVKEELLKHEKYYSFSRNEPEAVLPTPSLQPYLILCIEQLEGFSKQVFGDFLDIWTQFNCQQQDIHSINTTSCTLGFVIGVASATSPALRRLDLSVTNRLELQFFSLVDARKCFADILEALVVNAKLPFILSGKVLRAIASRHRRLPSIPRLLLALRLLLFTHFRRCPWSFLAFAGENVALIAESVAAGMTTLPRKVLIWIERHRHRLIRKSLEEGRTLDSSLVSWLTLCRKNELSDLSLRVLSSDTMNEADNWIGVLDSALHFESRRRAHWRLGWECFRAACVWLDVQCDGKEGDDAFVMELALALDGRLGEAPRFVQVLQRMQTPRWVVAVGMIQQWKTLCRVVGSFGDEMVEKTLSELAMLCAYARRTTIPIKMQIGLRNEIVTVFMTRLVIVLVQPRVMNSRADSLVSNWFILKDVHVLEERLRFKYHDHLRNILQEYGIGEHNGTLIGTNDAPSWVHDVGLAFLFYQESASSSLSLCEWYESFCFELEEEMRSRADTSTEKRKNADFRANPTIKARFVRALCTLRHWGFIQSDAPRDLEQDLIEKLVFV